MTSSSCTSAIAVLHVVLSALMPPPPGDVEGRSGPHPLQVGLHGLRPRAERVALFRNRWTDASEIMPTPPCSCSAVSVACSKAVRRPHRATACRVGVVPTATSRRGCARAGATMYAFAARCLIAWNEPIGLPNCSAVLARTRSRRRARGPPLPTESAATTRRRTPGHQTPSRAGEPLTGASSAAPTRAPQRVDRPRLQSDARAGGSIATTPSGSASSQRSTCSPKRDTATSPDRVAPRRTSVSRNTTRADLLAADGAERSARRPRPCRTAMSVSSHGPGTSSHPAASAIRPEDLERRQAEPARAPRAATDRRSRGRPAPGAATPRSGPVELGPSGARSAKKLWRRRGWPARRRWGLPAFGVTSGGRARARPRCCVGSRSCPRRSSAARART